MKVTNALHCLPFWLFFLFDMGAALDSTVDSVNTLMRGGATLRSDSTDENMYQVIKDLEKRIAEMESHCDLSEKRIVELESHRDLNEKKIADLEAELKSHQEAKLETKQEDVMGALKVILTQDDLISQIARDVIENPGFDDGVASLVQDVFANNHPPEDLMEQARSFPFPKMNHAVDRTIDETFFVDEETHLNAGEKTTLNPRDWCLTAIAKWVYHEGHGTFWEAVSVVNHDEWDNVCGRCPSGFEPTASLSIDFGSEMEFYYWNHCK